MAGARITLEIQDLGADQAISRLARFDTEVMPLVFADIGEYLKLSHAARFEAEESPDGTPWAALSPRYQQRKDRLRPGLRKLVFDNLLKGLLRYQVEPLELEFGTDRPYGAIQHFGGSEGMAPCAAAIPERPWLGLSAADDDEILAITGDHLERAAGGP